MSPEMVRLLGIGVGLFIGGTGLLIAIVLATLPSLAEDLRKKLSQETGLPKATG